MRFTETNRLWRHLPLLLGEFALGSAALAAVTLTVDEPRYEFLVHLALLLGLGVSALGIARKRLYALPGAVVMVTALFCYFARNYQVGPIALFFPPEVAGHQDLVLAGLVGWFLVAFSCWQSGRHNLIFLVVCGLATFGLTATVNLNSEMLVAFAAFMCAAVFCWGYEQFLDLDERLATIGQTNPARWLDMARGQLSVALLVGLLTLSIGGILGSGAYQVSPNLYAKMAERAYGWNVTPGRNNIFNSFTSAFRVGSGPVRLSPIPVMQVAADHAARWRGMVYDYYDGHGWSRTARGGYGLLAAGERLQVPSGLIPPMKSFATNRQAFKILNHSAQIFGSAQPLWMQPQSPLPPRFGPFPSAHPAVDPYGCLSWSGGDFGATNEYTVFSQEPGGSPAALRVAPADYSPAELQPYLQIPARTKLALDPLVRQITADASNRYDKVAALEAYLEQTCLYSMGAPATPAKEDAVAWFVSHSQRGACDLFSSSLAVMSRLAGVPARVATGYASGEYDPEAGYFLVKGTDAHAWTEIYFEGYGWVTFDATPAATYEEQSIGDLFTGGHWRLGLERTVHRIVVWCLVALVLLLAVGALVDPIAAWRRVLTRKPQTPLARVTAEYHTFYTLLLRRARLEVSPALTPQEAMAAVVQALPPDPRLDRRRLMELNQRFYRVRYSDDVPYAELAGLREELAAMRKRLRRR